jgi:FkbM family methyltransferase
MNIFSGVLKIKNLFNKKIFNIIKHKFWLNSKELKKGFFFYKFLNYKINFDKKHLANRNLIRFCLNSKNIKKHKNNQFEILYEREELKVFEKLIENAEYFLDIGAQTGIYSLAAYKAKNIKKIICVEIINEYIDSIKKNIKINNFLPAMFNIYNVALGSGKVSHEEWISKKTVSGISFETIVKMSNISLRENDCIKIDIEGWEFSLVNDIGKFFIKNKPKILLSFHQEEIQSLSNFKTKDKDIFNFLNSVYKYKYIIHKNSNLEEIKNFSDSGLDSKKYKTIIFSNKRL